MKLYLGVYCMITSREGILMVKKARGPYTGMLDLPGGRVEPEETLKSALEREVMEETGLDIGEANLVGVYQAFAEDLNLIGVYYKAKKHSGSIKTSPDGLDSNGAIWINRSELGKSHIAPNALKAIRASGWMQP